MGWINPPRISRRPKSPQVLGLNYQHTFWHFENSYHVSVVGVSNNSNRKNNAQKKHKLNAMSELCCCLFGLLFEAWTFYCLVHVVVNIFFINFGNILYSKYARHILLNIFCYQNWYKIFYHYIKETKGTYSSLHYI